MTGTYTITLHRSMLPDQVLLNVKGNDFPRDINFGDSAKFMLVIFEDETRRMVNLDKYQGYTLSKEFYFKALKDVDRESNGQAKAG